MPSPLAWICVASSHWEHLAGPCRTKKAGLDGPSICSSRALPNVLGSQGHWEWYTSRNRPRALC